ncbi:MAG: hypothetical protein Q9210_002520 [Variospora velana]
MECLGISHAYQGHHKEAEEAYCEALAQESQVNIRLVTSLRISLEAQAKWEPLETWSRQVCERGDIAQSTLHRSLITALEQQGKTQQALEVRARLLGLDTSDLANPQGRPSPIIPPVRDNRRFGRMIHPRTWSS